MGAKGLTPETPRLRWRQPVGAHRACLLRAARRLREHPGERREMLQVLGAFYAIVAFGVVVSRLLDLGLPAPILWLVIAAPPAILLLPPLLRCVIPRTVLLRDTRIEVVDNFESIVVPVDALESYTLCDEGRWRMLWLRRKDGVWNSWAMPSSTDFAVLHAWMRERGLPALASTGPAPEGARP